MDLQFQDMTAKDFKHPQGLPSFTKSAEAMHDEIIALTIDQFRANAGTTHMIPTSCVTVMPDQGMIRVWDMPWENEDEKIRMLVCLRAIFGRAEHRPSIYTMVSEVWLASMTAEEHAANPNLKPREHPARLDGLSIITVEDKPGAVPLFTAYTRDPEGNVELHTDSRTGLGFDGEYSGRLADLFKPSEDDPEAARYNVAGIVTTARKESN